MSVNISHSTNSSQPQEKNIPSSHHSFNIEYAIRYGIKEAIIIHHFEYWICLNKRNNRNFHDGRTWTYQTLEEIAEHYPYMTKEEVKNIIDKLCKGYSRFSKKDEVEFNPILIKGNYNKSAFDKTTWYALSVEPSISKNVYEEVQTPHREVNAPHPESSNTSSIPDSIPYSKPTDTKKEEKKEGITSRAHDPAPVQVSSDPQASPFLFSFFSFLKLDIKDPRNAQKLIDTGLAIKTLISSHKPILCEFEALLNFIAESDFWRPIIDGMPKLLKHYQTIKGQLAQVPPKKEDRVAVNMKKAQDLVDRRNSNDWGIGPNPKDGEIEIYVYVGNGDPWRLKLSDKNFDELFKRFESRY